MNFKQSFAGILKKVREKRKFSPKTPFRKFIPLLYLKTVFLGMALTGMQASFLPQMVICSSLFGANECDPLGNYVVALSSLPGYLFTGKIMSFWPSAPSYAFFTVLFGLSLIFYWFLGYLIDKRVGKQVQLKDVIVFLTFAALLTLLAMLFALI